MLSFTTTEVDKNTLILIKMMKNDKNFNILREKKIYANHE